MSKKKIPQQYFYYPSSIERPLEAVAGIQKVPLPLSLSCYESPEGESPILNAGSMDLKFSWKFHNISVVPCVFVADPRNALLLMRDHKNKGYYSILKYCGLVWMNFTMGREFAKIPWIDSMQRRRIAKLIVPFTAIRRNVHPRLSPILKMSDIKYSDTKDVPIPSALLQRLSRVLKHSSTAKISSFPDILENFSKNA